MEWQRSTHSQPSAGSPGRHSGSPPRRSPSNANAARGGHSSTTTRRARSNSDLNNSMRAKRASADMSVSTSAAKNRLIELIQRPASTPPKKRVTFNLVAPVAAVEPTDSPRELRRQLDDSAYTLEVLQRRALELQRLVEFQNEEKRALEEAFLDVASVSCASVSSNSSVEGREMVDAAVHVVDEQARLEQEAMAQREAALAEEAAQRQREIEATRRHLRELELSLAERNEEHARLTERVYQLDSLLRERTTELERLRMKLTDALKYQETSHAIHSAASADLAARVVEKDEELTARTAEVRRLQTVLADSINNQAVIDQMQEELERREQELADLRQELIEARDREERYFTNGGNEDREALRQLRDEYDQLVRESSRAFTIMATQQEELEQRCRDMDTVNGELHQEHQLSVAETDRFRKRAAEMEAKLDLSEKHALALIREHTDEQRMLHDQAVRIQEFEASLQQAEGDKEELQEQVRELKAKVNRQRVQLVRQEASKGTHEEAVAELNHRLEQTAQQLRLREQQMETMRRETRSALENYQEIEMRCQQQSSQLGVMERMQQELQHQLTDEQSIRARLESEIELLTGQLEEAALMGGDPVLMDHPADRALGSHIGDGMFHRSASPVGSFTSLHDETTQRSFASELGGLAGSAGSFGGEVLGDVFGSPHSSIGTRDFSPAPSVSSLALPAGARPSVPPAIAVGDADHEQLRQDLELARERTSKLRNELDEKEVKLVCVQAELSAAQSDHQRTKDTLVDVQGKLRTAVERERDLTSEVDDMRADLRQAREERDEIRQRIDEIESDADGAAEKLAVARMEREYAEEAVAALERDLQQAAEKAEVRVAEVRSELESKSRALATAGARLAETEAELRSNIDKGILQEAEIAKSRAERDELAATMDGLRTLLGSKREEIERLQDEIDGLGRQLKTQELCKESYASELQQQLRACEAELARVCAKVGEQRDMAEFSANEADICAERIAELETEVEALRARNAGLDKDPMAALELRAAGERDNSMARLETAEQIKRDLEQKLVLARDEHTAAQPSTTDRMLLRDSEAALEGEQKLTTSLQGLLQTLTNANDTSPIMLEVEHSRLHEEKRAFTAAGNVYNVLRVIEAKLASINREQSKPDRETDPTVSTSSVFDIERLLVELSGNRTATDAMSARLDQQQRLMKAKKKQRLVELTSATTRSAFNFAARIDE